ncbi:MAG: DEAD/DEAH box helicase [Bacteroidales bacterium]|nr:DEAD/DEAH box helicase [Bacteroidales bacterium]
MSDVFSRYAPFIQDFIYRNEWQSLRAIQAAAGEAVFYTDKNVLLAASTASGKTEAAFFPILTLMQENPPTSVGCLYIAPLKALINDQFSRLNDICKEAGITVWHWHGDVSQSQKQKLLKHPSGILQITPESLEALLLHRHNALPHLFGDLRFIVIDEIHSFLRGDRGGQTLCLVERLARLAGVNPRRIGLSATVGDPKAVAQFLSAGTGRGTIVPRLQGPRTNWRISMEHFFNSAPQADEGRVDDFKPLKRKPLYPNRLNSKDISPTSSGKDGDLILDKTADPGLLYIFHNTRGRKCLVFSNSREECEAVTTTLRQYCETVHEPDRFLIHHGNLSASLRQSAEELIKDDGNLSSICTTSTLELGIDVGRLERAFQIDAPYTVGSFLQRMGRTGRRGNPSEMWFVVREEHGEARALLPATIPWRMLQAIALVQLYVEERWVEPPRTERLPYSLLYHQTMSTLASGGEMNPAELAHRVLTLSYFSNVSQDDFRVLLRHLIATRHVEQTENGGLIVGLAGERVVNNFKFYAVFQENEEYHVRCESQELGTVVKPPPVGDKLAIAGHTWVVEEVDAKRHLIYCHQVKGKVPAYFGLEPGDLHTRILERMRRVLGEETVYPYLLPHAKARLAQARHVAECGGVAQQSSTLDLVSLGGNMYCLMPWLGSYSFLALERFLKIRCAERLGLKGLDSLRPYYMQFTMKTTPKEFVAILKDEADKPLNPLDLVYPNEVPIFDKYDDLLPEELVRKGFALGVLDVKEMVEWIEKT